MHPFQLLNLIGCVVSAALVSAILTRDSGARSSRIMAAILACGGFWAFLQMIAAGATSAEEALPILRTFSFAYLPLGPLCLHLLLELRPELGTPYRRLLGFAYATLPLLALGTLVTPWFIAEARQVAWGWTPINGIAFPLTLIATAGYPVMAALSLARTRKTDSSLTGPAARRVAFAVGIPLGVIVGGDILYSHFDPDQPQLGTITMVLIGGALWLRSIYAGRVLASRETTAREILDNLSHGVALLARDGGFRSVNRSLARLVGPGADDLSRLKLAELLPDVSQAVLRGGLEEQETMLCAGSSDPIPVSVSSGVIRDRRGWTAGLVLVVKDQRQVVELRRHLVTNTRLAAVGELAAGIAHEVNNPVAFIRANLSLLRQHLASIESELAKEGRPGSDIGTSRSHIEQSLQELGQVVSIVREVVGFAHSGSEGAAAHDVNALLDSAVNLATLRRGDAAAVVRRYGDLPPIHAPGRELKQVFLSLLLNASRSAPTAGAIRVSTEERDGRVVVEIEDDGWTVAPRLVERGFDPAMSELETGNVGLTLSYQVMQKLGGSLMVESVPGGGTRVSLHLPLSLAYEDSEAVGGGA